LLRKGGILLGHWIIAAVAVISTGGCITLWFRGVQSVMRERESTVDSAAGQLALYRDKARKDRGDPQAANLLERSEKIYRQAVESYNGTIRKPWVYLPATLMHFRVIPRENG